MARTLQEQLDGIDSLIETYEAETHGPMTEFSEAEAKYRREAYHKLCIQRDKLQDRVDAQNRNAGGAFALAEPFHR